MTPRVLELREYEPTPVKGVTVEEIRALQARLPALRADYQGGDRWILTANHNIGFLQVGDLQVHIRPKITMQTVLFLLGYAVDDIRWQPEQTQVDQFERPIDVLAHFLAGASHRATRSGVLQNYHEQDAALRVVRGQWQINEQIRKHHGRPLPVQVIYDDYTEDVAENQIVVTALQLLRRTAPALAARRAVARALAPFTSNITVLPRQQWTRLPDISWTTLNRHYRSAVEVASLVLREAAISHNPGGTEVSGILINMNTAFERFVRRALRRELQQPGGRLWKPDSTTPIAFDAAGVVGLEPDILWSDRGTLRLVGDAKYKKLSPAGFKHADLYQMHAYCVATNLPAGLLIYGDSSRQLRRHHIPGSNITISVVAVDLQGTDSDIRTSMLSIAEEARDLTRISSMQIQM